MTGVRIGGALTGVRIPSRKRTKRTANFEARSARKRPAPTKDPGKPARKNPGSSKSSELVDPIRGGTRPPAPKKKRRPSLPRPLTYREQKGQRLVEYAETGNELACRDLLADGFTDHNFRDPTRDLKTALIVSVEKDFRHVVRALLEHPAVNRDLPDAFGKQALDYACCPEVKLLFRDSDPATTSPPAGSSKRKRPPEMERHALKRENTMLWTRVSRLQTEKDRARKEATDLQERLKVTKGHAFQATLAKTAIRSENSTLKKTIATLTTENEELKARERKPFEIRLQKNGAGPVAGFPRILPSSITGLQTVARSALSLASTIQDRIAEIQRCSVCQDRSCNSTLVPCGHMFCRECTTELNEKSQSCPTCRGTIEHITRSINIM